MSAVPVQREATEAMPGSDLWPATAEDFSILREPFRNASAEYLALAFSAKTPATREGAAVCRALPVNDFPVHVLLSCLMLCRWGIMPVPERDGAQAVLLAASQGCALILVQMQGQGEGAMSATMLVRRSGPRREWSRDLASRTAPPRLSAFVLRCYYRALR